MSNTKARGAYKLIIYLISCALAGKKPDKSLIDTSLLEAVHKIASRHSLSAIVAYSLEKVGLADATFLEEKNLAIKKVILLDAERRAIFSECDKLGIRYMPLKGVIMKDLYPYVGLRQMSDNDILIDDENREALKDIMVSRGYEVYMFNDGNHDVYMKNPVYNYELHVSLFGDNFEPRFKEYFSTAFDEGIKVSENGLCYAMTDEYYYVYFKAHEYKHWRGGGTGLRSLVDTYVFLNAKNALNDEKIKAELKELGIYEYEQKTRALSLKIFDPTFAERNVKEDMLTDEEEYFLEDFLLHGTYGSQRKSIENSIKKIDEANENGGVGKAKMKYVLSMVFRPTEFYRKNYPLARKYKILIPFFMIKRVFELIFVRSKSSFKTLKTVLKYKKK